jgi:nicotinamide-nucleotide amidase
MKAEIIASGTELLLGEVADTNTAFIANQLASLGIDLYYASIVGDNFDRFLGVLKQARQRSDIIIITGGLGPTKGDITREVIAGLVGETMVIEPTLKKTITEYFARLGMEMPDNNLKQATLIHSAISIPNPQGTAPGWWVENQGKIIISLPGPPGEMQSVWQKEVFPRLKTRGTAVIFSRTLKTWGLSEAKIDQMVGPYMSMSNPTLALYAKSDGIQLRITSKAASLEEAEGSIRERESQLRQILKDHIWGIDDDKIENLIARLLIDKGLTLAVAESFTGGFLSYTLSSLPESNQFFKGSLVTLDAGVREDLNLIPKTPNSTADIHSAERMAALVRDQFSADIGIGIDGFLDSCGEPPSGQTFIALDLRQKEHNTTQYFHWRLTQLTRRAVMHTLFTLRKVLLDL